MGNKMCVIRRNAVADRFTRPRRLLRQPSDVDYKKLRKLILSQKLAPCFDAVEELDRDLEECPICFLYYPSLNRSRCCAKGICTECFLQMKPRHTTRPAHCPFCKTSGYAVEYTGARSEEEKSLEQAEEQKVIEAKIRMQSESQIVDWVMPVNQPRTLLDSLHPLPDMEGLSVEQAEDPDAELGGSGVEKVQTCVSQGHRKHDLDLEEIMVLEAIWKSLQDSSVQISESSGISSQNHQKNFSNFALAEDVAVAIAILTEQDRTKQAVPDPNYGRRQIDLSPCENFVNDSSIQRETGCSSGSSCLNTLKRPCKFAAELNA